MENPVDKALESGSVVALANHTVLLAKDGSEIPIDDTAAPIREENGFTRGAVLVFRDITARRRTERKLQDSNEQLQLFVTGAAHDLRSPLNSINAVAELMTIRLGDTLPPENLELLGYIRSGAARVLRLLEDLLAYAQASNFETDPAVSASLNGAVNTALDNLRSEIEETGARIIAQPLPSVMAREAHLVQLFQNLVGNALKYRGAEPPSIQISAERGGREWIVRVTDNGIGIEPAYRDEIFKPFKRLHGQEIPGSGIGLAACQKIVAGYRGRLWVESEPGHGSTFLFTFPVAGRNSRT